MKNVFRVVSFLMSFFIMLSLPYASLADGTPYPEAPADYGIEKLENRITAVAVSDNCVCIGNGKDVIILGIKKDRLQGKGFTVSMPDVVTALKINKNMLYAAAGSSELYIFDISSPDQPVKKGVYKLKSGFVEDIEIQSQTVYMADNVNGLVAVNVSDPSRPVLSGQAFGGKNALGLAAYHDAVYIAAGEDGFSVADIAQSKAPKELSQFKTSTGATDAVLWGGYAYVSGQSQDLYIVDITGRPFCVKTIDVQIPVEGMARVRNYLFVAGSDKGFRVLDIATPTKPVEILGAMPESHSLTDVEAHGNKVYFVNNGKGLLYYDITGSADLKPAGEINIRGDKVYVTEASGSSTTIELQKLPELPPEPEVSSVPSTPAPASPPTNPTPSKTPIPPSQTPPPSIPSPDDNSKVAYITIDDGPSRNNTPKILDILKDYGIKATFFVLPNDSVTDIYKRILDEGHVIGNHSYSHDYDYLYSSPDNFKNDVLKARNYIYNKLNYTTTLFRFPGGAMGKDKEMINRRVSILRELGYSWFDWNASAGDAEPGIRKYTKEEDIVNQLISNVINRTYSRKKLIVLLHDSSPKIYTVKALPKIIDELIQQGYRFDVLSNY